MCASLLRSVRFVIKINSKHQLQPLPIPSMIWENITMDFVEGLPISGGYDSILVVVDRLSKFAHFSALKHPFTVPTVASIFVRDVVKFHGIPRSIISDQDKVFISYFWHELFKLQGTCNTLFTSSSSKLVTRCYLSCKTFLLNSCVNFFFKTIY